MIENIIAKVRKLRALATSSNVHEAAAAAAAAERLIQEHALSESQLTEEEELPIVPGEPIDTYGRRAPIWKLTLLNFLAKQYRCASWRQQVWNGREMVQEFRAVGRASDLELLRYQAAFFTAEVTRLTERHGKGKGRTWRNSFSWGAVDAVMAAMRDAQQAARSTATSTALARVDAVADAALALRNRVVPNLRTQKNYRTVDRDAYAQGQRAGAGINQRSSLGAGGSRLLGA